jgi:hypothetical protein
VSKQNSITASLTRSFPSRVTSGLSLTYLLVGLELFAESQQPEGGRMKLRAIALIVGLLLAAMPFSPAYSDTDIGQPPPLPSAEVALCTAQPFGAGHGGIDVGPRLAGTIEWGATGECTGAPLETLDADLWYSPSGIGFYQLGIACSGPTVKPTSNTGVSGPCGISSLDDGYYGVSATVCSPSSCFQSPMIPIAAPVTP